MIHIGEMVKVIDQDIIGRVIYNDGSHIIIEDMDSEFLSPDNTLEYHTTEVEPINKVLPSHA
jgi:hypothetical protein